MKKDGNTREAYIAPQTEVIKMEPEGVIATSVVEQNPWMPEEPDYGNRSPYRGFTIFRENIFTDD